MVERSPCERRVESVREDVRSFGVDEVLDLMDCDGRFRDDEE